MSYNKTNWTNGDLITAEKMNNIENGVAFANGFVGTEPESGRWVLFDQNGDYYFIDECQWSCFRGDTTYVTMFDGSKKLIQDIKIGDSVLGYDVNSKQYCEAVVVKNVRTGEQTYYDCYVFDDGTTVDIAGEEEFITKRTSASQGADYIEYDHLDDMLERYRNNTLGDRRIIKDTGNLENTVIVIDKKEFQTSKYTGRHSLVTSNGTYFVNGLLHIEPPTVNVDLLNSRHTYIPDYIKTIYDSFCLEWAAEDESLPDDHIKHPEDVGDIMALREAQAIIAQNKEYLASTDYKAMKYAEGALTDEEWLPVKQLRADARAAINENEVIVAEYGALVTEKNPEFYRTEDVETIHAWLVRWKRAQATLDSHLNDFKTWADEQNRRASNKN